MNEPVAGKFLLEILTKGMYSNPMHVFREYIQNSADSIDKAIRIGLLEKSEAAIKFHFDQFDRSVSIKDNGVGLSSEDAKTVLLSVGNSEKDGVIERGFRGIGRLGGLAYADKVQFITSAYGENRKTIMSCDCVRMKQLLQKSNTETTDIMETFNAFTSFEVEKEETDQHYFQVSLIGISKEAVLLDENAVMDYLSETAPVDFDAQSFIQGSEINRYFEEHGYLLPTYNIYRGTRTKPLYKLYSRSLTTGKRKINKATDYVRKVEFVYEKAADGSPLYIGWLAITDFRGIIAEDSLQGIRLRKGNILIGNHTTFAKFFPSEGSNANRMFAGEIHAIHSELVPNSQRDDFEPNEIYNELKSKLGAWAYQINKTYRRGTSKANAALKKLGLLNKEQQELEENLSRGLITSDAKREDSERKLNRIIKNREAAEKEVRKAQRQGNFDPERLDTINRTLEQTAYAAKRTIYLANEIVNTGYATKEDLPSNYSRDERKLYQRIIMVIDDFFISSPETATALRESIKKELSVKKK